MPSYDATSDLLARALDARFANRAYLPWFYGANPRGEAIEENIDENGTRVAHYAVLPTVYRTTSGPTPFIFSSNVATDPAVRRGGLFREMAEKVYARAAHTGAPGMVGVGNDASTVVVVERFGWRKLGPMPVRVCVPTGRARTVESGLVDGALLASTRLADLAADLDWVPVTGWVQAWDAPFLRWRLSRPGAHYVVHVSPDAIAVSTRERAPGGIPAAVLLKVFPRPGARLPVDGAPFVRAACRFERAPICVYAGHNAHVRVHGVRPPRRLQPSPLNVVLKPLDERRAAPDRFRLDTFEFLDMDAY
jgi:hypothetical protein